MTETTNMPQTTSSIDSDTMNSMLAVLEGKNVNSDSIHTLEESWKSRLTDNELQRIEELKDSLELGSSNILTYGADVQQKVRNSSTVNSILNSTITEKMGPAGEALTTTLVAIKNNGQIEPTNGLTRFFRKIKLFKETTEFNSADLKENIEYLEKLLADEANNLYKLAVDYDNMRADNIQLYYELNTYIFAAELKLQEALAELEADTERLNSESLTPIEKNIISDKTQAVKELARRINELYVARYLAAIQDPEITALKYNARELAMKMVSVAQNLAPMLSQQYAIAIGHSAIKQSIDCIEKVQAGFEEMLIANSEALKKTAIATSTVTEKSFISAGTVDTLTKNVMDSLQSGEKLYNDILVARKEAEKKMIESEIKLSELFSKEMGDVSLLSDHSSTSTTTAKSSEPGLFTKFFEEK